MADLNVGGCDPPSVSVIDLIEGQSALVGTDEKNFFFSARNRAGSHRFRLS